MRPAKAFYRARDLLLSFGPRSFINDRYAALNRRNESHLLAKLFFVVFATDSPEKSLNFWRRAFSFDQPEWWRPDGTLLELTVAH